MFLFFSINKICFNIFLELYYTSGRVPERGPRGHSSGDEVSVYAEVQRSVAGPTEKTASTPIFIVQFETEDGILLLFIVILCIYFKIMFRKSF